MKNVKLKTCEIKYINYVPIRYFYTSLGKMLFPVSSKFQDGIRLVKSSLLTCKLLFLSERIGLRRLI